MAKVRANTQIRSPLARSLVRGAEVQQTNLKPPLQGGRGGGGGGALFNLTRAAVAATLSGSTRFTGSAAPGEGDGGHASDSSLQ